MNSDLTLQADGWIKCFGTDCGTEFRANSPRKCPRLACGSTDLRMECLGCGNCVKLEDLSKPCLGCVQRLEKVASN